MRFRPAQIFGDIQTFTILEKLHVFIILKKSIGFSIKIHLGYLETHLFTTLGGGVKHGIQISIEITKFQIPTFCSFFMNYDITQFVKNGWVSNLDVFKKTKSWNIQNQILHQISARLPRDSPLYDPWWWGKTWNTGLNRNDEISNIEFIFVFKWVFGPHKFLVTSRHLRFLKNSTFS